MNPDIKLAYQMLFDFRVAMSIDERQLYWFWIHGSPLSPHYLLPDVYWIDRIVWETWNEQPK